MALAACAELRPYLRREFGWPLTELGRVRFQMGDLRGAEEAFLAARQAGWDPEPGLALVRLAQGDVALAAASIRDALEHPLTIPSKELPPNTDLRRAPLLAARVEIEVAAGDLVAARDAADELARVAASFESRALAASAAMADGRVRLAAGEVTGARHAFQTAVRLWSLVGAPYQLALARTGLASAHRAAGDEAVPLEWQRPPRKPGSRTSTAAGHRLSSSDRRPRGGLVAGEDAQSATASETPTPFARRATTGPSPSRITLLRCVI